MPLHSQHSRRSDLVALWAAALLLVAALVFGGGSRGAGDLVVQLCALPALGLALLRWHHGQATRAQRWFAYWLLAALAVVALQLLPLPAAWFARLPQRAAVLADLRSAGLDPAWLPMSLDRYGTVRALLAVAVFGTTVLLAGTLPAAGRLRLLQLAVVAAVAMGLLGFYQAAAGPHAPLRLYAYHHPIGAIGTFANRNHFASLLAMLLPLALALAVRAQHRRSPAMPWWYASVVLLLLAAALSFSRAGFALACVAVLAAAAVLFGSRAGRPRRLVPALAGLAGVLAIGYYAWAGLMQRLEQDPLADLRWQYLHYGLQAAGQYLPWGSGAGSFPWVYAPLEPVQAMLQVFAERAHNDLLQVAIEAGVPGLLLVAALLTLGVSSCLRNFLVRRSTDIGDHGLVSVVGISLLVPLLHSLVDYPLRTYAVLVPFGLLLSLCLGSGSPADGRRQDPPL
ncbi:MAG: O-antigen ligase domain-containing protein [Lysobacteraceae bacterium]|nr:MAG: O-antigen ligase domain-containing protein [Xanthomonadaceae bacterium]